MGYMDRLGLWGPGTPFPAFNGSKGFMDLEAGGLSAAELVAMELKVRGQYVSRMLSYHGVKFFLHRVTLSPGLRALYDRCARIWGLLLELANSHTEDSKNEDGGAVLIHCTHYTLYPLYTVPTIHCTNSALTTGPGKMFWMYHQSFFLQLITAVKVPEVIKVCNL
jgi:hypothetical protein